MDVQSESLHYDYFDLGPAFQLALLLEGSRMVSFDIYHFSSVFTYNHGNPINVGETDEWYTATRLSEDFLLPAYILKLIRKKIAGLPPDVLAYVSRGLDEYENLHRDAYSAAETR